MSSKNDDKIINFKKEEDKNFVDNAADWLNEIKIPETKLGFYLIQRDDKSFNFDWFGDHMKMIAFLDYAKTVILKSVIDYCEED